MNKIKLCTVCFLLAKMLTVSAIAQSGDSIADGRNVVKFNLSTPLLYSSAFVFSYERVVTGRQTFAITAGSMQMPNLVPSSGMIQVDKEVKKSGFTVGAEYRFYLRKENKYAAPRGIYLGPYVNLYSFHNERLLSIISAATTTPATFNSDFLFTNIGFQVGYQFILNNRFSIDMIFFGPSLSNYALDLKLNGSLTADEEDALVNALLDRLPLLGELLDGKTISANGRTSTWSGGYRFTLLAGYKFGRKKNQ